MNVNGCILKNKIQIVNDPISEYLHEILFLYALLDRELSILVAFATKIVK